MQRRALVLSLAAVLASGAACGRDGRALQLPPDGLPRDAGPRDAGTVDAGTVDAGAVDAGAVDGGAPDAGCISGTRFDAATATCVDSCNPGGLLHDQPLQVGSETRHYMLYVPPSYSCDGGAWPLLIDFHGTWSGSESDHGEEFYALDGLLAEADAQRFIVARPRSRSSIEGGSSVYRWDQNRGDYDRNAAFAHALVEHLQALYAVDPARTYAAGFSSGTGMAAHFFADQPQVFHGYGFVGGGYFQDEPPAAVNLGAAPPRIYAVTGYRDYLFPDQQRLVDLLSSTGYPTGKLFRRGSDNGHELYGWHFRELLAWLDRGVRPAPGGLDGGWVAEATSSSTDLVALALDPDGGALAVGAEGRIARRALDGTWTEAGPFRTRSGAPAFSGVCLAPDGRGVAVGEGQAAQTVDLGQTFTPLAIPSFNVSFFDPPRPTAVACNRSQVVTAGNWDAAHQTDGGAWLATTVTSQFGFPAQVAQVKVSDAGTWIASGYYNYLGRSVDGVSFTPMTTPVATQWLMGIASAPGGRWWVAGDTGTLLASIDDGLTWSAQDPGTTEDLYAVAFADAQRGMAVGAHGTALLTLNGGATWSHASTGLDDYLGDVAWLDGHTVLAIGGGGRALTLRVP